MGPIMGESPSSCTTGVTHAFALKRQKCIRRVRVGRLAWRVGTRRKGPTYPGALSRNGRALRLLPRIAERFLKHIGDCNLALTRMASFGLYQKPENKECANCGTLDSLALCSRCHAAWFCSVKCQKVRGVMLVRLFLASLGTDATCVAGVLAFSQSLVPQE